MTDLETLIVFVLGFLPALIFWIVLISYVTNKIFDSIERDKQKANELTGYSKFVNQIKKGVEEEPVIYFEHPKEWKEKRDEYLKRNSDYEVAKNKYVEDKLNDYLNTEEAINAFTGIFGTEFETHEWKRDTWKCHLNVKRDEFGTDFDNL